MPLGKNDRRPTLLEFVECPWIRYTIITNQEQ